MILKPKNLLYFITIAVVIAVVVWEYYMQQWMAYQPDGGTSVMRVDLFVIYPLVITLVALSLYRRFKK
jgi:hypothetical protein